MLVGKHTRLRIVDAKDAEYMRQLRNSPEISRQFQSRHFLSDGRQKLFFDEISRSDLHIYFVAETLVDSIPFGFYFVRNVDHRNQRGQNGAFLDPQRNATGIESLEAAFLLLQYEFSYLNLHKVYAEILPENTRAIRFNEALGMREECILRQHIYYDGRFHDVLRYYLLREDFQKRPTTIMRSFLSNREE